MELVVSIGQYSERLELAVLMNNREHLAVLIGQYSERLELVVLINNREHLEPVVLIRQQ